MSTAEHSTPQVSTESNPIDRLVDLLRQNGDLSDHSLQRAQRATAGEGLRIDRALNRLGLISDDALVGAWSTVTGLPVARFAEFPDAPALGDQLPRSFLLNARCFPLQATSTHVLVALEDPLDQFTPSAISAKTGLVVDVAITARSDLERALQKLISSASETTFEAALLPHDEGFAGDAERLRDLASDAPVIRFVNDMVERAVEMSASDIHLTAVPGGSRLRYRVDGLLREMDTPPFGMHAAIISRVKIMAGLDIAERRLPQDGRIRAAFRGREVDFRVATMPHAHGEGVVLRLLDRSSIVLDLLELGHAPNAVEELKKALAAPHGMVLVAGPTGSGKTTTLYAALAEVRRDDRNVITIEDPVEYYLDGINQIAVSRRIGLDFPQALRAVLRQDPDVILVGEIRDRETAVVATQAALTGHLVLATVHTNTAAAALPRLIDMGVEPFLLASTVRGVLSQRLVRRLCPHCREPMPTAAGLGARAESSRGIVSPTFEAPGCPSCGGSGYRGRAATSEFLVITDDIRRSVIAKADEAAIAVIARKSGFRDIVSDAWEKAALGITSAAEVLRATGNL